MRGTVFNVNDDVLVSDIHLDLELVNNFFSFKVQMKNFFYC